MNQVTSILILPLKLEGYHYGMMIFGFVFVSIFLFLWFKSLASRFWANGMFPPFLKATETNLIEAYSALGALMLSIDRETAGDKVDYMLSYFARNFKSQENNHRENIIYAMRNQVTPKSITNWINSRFSDNEKKSAITHFLVQVGMVDGILTKNERTFIKMINGYLNLSPSLVDKLISDIDTANREKQESRQNRIVRRPSSYAYQTLGISPNASDEEIKKAYRTLVKKHHPDNFANASAQKLTDAKQRFIEIQQAYEHLTE